jgi:hypothetical protein
MYGLALSVVLVLVIIYCMTCAFGIDFSKMSSKNNAITLLTNTFIPSVAHLPGPMSPDPASNPEAGLPDTDQNFTLRERDTAASIDELNALEGYADQTNNVSQVGVYDPLEMGVVKKKEVEAHHRNLAERSPYSTVGTAPPGSYVRDDDPYTRESGVPWVGGIPNRADARAPGGGGPQAGARESVGASSESIASLSRMAKRAPKWNG